MDRPPMFLDRQNQYRQNDPTAKRVIQIQSNPHQNTRGILHRTRKKNPKIHVGNKQKVSEKPK